jgi:hypothetical protein
MPAWNQTKLYDRIRQRYDKRVKIRQPWEEPCDEIIDMFRPDMTQFSDDYDNINFPGKNIYSSYPAWCLNVMDRGFRGYTISKALEWFRHKIKEQELQGIDQVNKWLQSIQRYMLDTYSGRSNLYEALGPFSRQALSTGSPVLLAEEDYELNKIVCLVPHPRQRYLGHNIFGDPDELILEWEYSIRDAVRSFGLENLSIDSQNRYKQGKFLQKEKFIQIICHHKDPMFEEMPEGEKKPPRRWPCMFIQKNTDELHKKVLYRMKNGYPRYGYNERNFTTWHYMRDWPYDYAFTPGWFSRFDAQSLMQMEKSKLMVSQKSADPPVWAPAFMKASLRLYPGAKNWYDIGQENLMPRSIVEKMDWPLNYEQSNDTKENIKRWFNIDFFRMASDKIAAGGSFPTNPLVMAALGEKAALLGPTLEYAESTWMTDIDRIFVSIEDQAGRLPVAPDIVEYYSDGEIIPEFVGPLHVMQREFHMRRQAENALIAVEPYFAYWPETKHKIKAEEAVERILEQNDFFQDAIRDKAEYDEIIKAMVQRQELQENVEMAERVAKAVPSLQKDTPIDSPLNQLMQAGANISG